LKLSRTQTHAQKQGISAVNTETYHSVSIHLRSRLTDWHTTLNCAILSHITGTTPSNKLDIRTWKIPKDIKLADEQFDQPGSTDILIGADLFYDMLRSDRRTLPGDYPGLQETFFGWILSGRTPATTTQHDPQPTFMLREDNSLGHNLNCSREVEPVEPSTMTIEQQVCKQHVITHTTQQGDGETVDRLPTKMDPKQLGFSRLASERRLHIFERRLEQELKDQYHYFIRKSKGLDHWYPVNTQEGTKHATVYQSSSLQGNKFHDNDRITMESNN